MISQGSQMQRCIATTYQYRCEIRVSHTRGFRRHAHPLSLALTSARLSSNIPAMTTRPLWAAQCRGLVPLYKITKQ
jgi:hypothetical protein